jgi:hypothetical protein
MTFVKIASLKYEKTLATGLGAFCWKETFRRL